MKILVSIISCAHYRGNRLRVCLDTWGKDIDDLIIFSGESGEENKPDDGGVCKIIKASNSDENVRIRQALPNQALRCR